MTTLLQVQINASIFSGNGQSSRLANQFVAAWHAANPHAAVRVRDFLRFIGIEEVEFIYAEGLNISEASKQKALSHADAAIAQLSSRSPQPRDATGEKRLPCAGVSIRRQHSTFPYPCRPLREPIAQYGPFVMNTPEEIEQAIIDFQSGKFNQSAVSAAR